MRVVEVSQTLNVGEKHQGDEVQGGQVGEIPLHVWQDQEAKGVRLGWRTKEYFLSFRLTRDDHVYPVKCWLDR